MSAAAKVASEAVNRVTKEAKRWPKKAITLTNVLDNKTPISISPDHDLPMGSWSSEQIRESADSHFLLTWAPNKTRHNIPIITHGEGPYVFDDKGNKFLDWTSQAVCVNLGYSLPESMIQATANQMRELPFCYSGLGIPEIRARMSKLVAEILPGDLEGMVFPSTGSEANEAAIMMARRYTGKTKVINFYRSYHGGTANSLQATGDSRRLNTGDRIPGFVKAFNPSPLFFELGGNTEKERCDMALNMLEEQVLNEGPDTVALIQLESITGGGGALIPPKGYMQGVRAICDKYDILLQFDEVMMGFGRTGEMFGFQHFEGVLPDIISSAKGISSGAIPLSMCACRKHIKDAFEDKPLGWGSTYQAHPVALAAAYENLKYFLKEDILGGVQKIAPLFENEMLRVAENHPSIKQYRAIGLFGCYDAHSPSGEHPSLGDAAMTKPFAEYKKAMTDNGLIGLLRPPHMHIAPALNITEDQLLDGFDRMDKALYTLDDELGF